MTRDSLLSTLSFLARSLRRIGEVNGGLLGRVPRLLRMPEPLTGLLIIAYFWRDAELAQLLEDKGFSVDSLGLGSAGLGSKVP